MSTSNESIPIVLLGGYLGAGKTTLLNALLAAPGVPRTTVLVNDFGAINVDASLIQNSEGGVLSLANGCACCSMSDDLITTLLDVIDARASPELIVIELSGIAEPARVAGILSLVPGVTHVATSVLIDGARIGQLARDPQLAPLINAQLGAADDFVVQLSVIWIDDG